jgi:cytochrome P450
LRWEDALLKTPIHYDPLDPATLADPYPLYARLRQHAPILWHEGMKSWLLSRYADCVAVLRDHERFARDWRRVGQSVPEPSLSVQSLDPPDQAPLRGLFLRSLHAADLDGIAARAQARLGELFGALAARQRFDLVAEIARPMSLQVICDLLGVDQPELESFAAVSDAIMASMDAGLAPETIEPGRLARQRLTALVESWFSASDRPGLLADVMGGHGAFVPELFVQNTARVMFQGGYSTMVAAIGNVVHTLLRHPHALKQLADPQLLRTGADELVRFDGPVQGTSRVATRSTTIGGTTIKAGQVVLTLFAAANHDPAQFEAPGELLLDRSPNQHLGFGWGPHACLGTVLAQIALRALVAALLTWPVPLRAAGPARRRPTVTMRSLETLPVTFRW